MALAAIAQPARAIHASKARGMRFGLVLKHMLHIEELNRTWPRTSTPEGSPHGAREVHGVTHRNQPSFPLPTVEVARNLPMRGRDDTPQEVLSLATGADTATGDDACDVE